MDNKYVFYDDQEQKAKEAVEKFLKGLSKLTEIYGVGVSGCGCCGSPYLFGFGGFLGDHLTWDEEEKVYKIEKEKS